MARTLEFKSGMHDTLFVTDANRIYHPIYEFNKGPVRIEVLDSTLLPNAEMFIALDGVAENSGWKMYPLGGTDTVYSSSTINIGEEQLIPQWGLLVQVKQVEPWNGDCSFILDCSVEQSADPWLTWLNDSENAYHYSNWIRSGMLQNPDWPSGSDYSGDFEECFENILEGTWAPYKLSSHADSVASPTWNKFKSLNDIENSFSVDMVITSDQSKWSRCPVFEIADNHVPAIGNQDRFNLRLSPSVDKNGNPDGSETMGMSWFPGYAINLETGERLNMAFGENSWLQAENGADMVWNPTSNVETPNEDPIMGGGHYIYVFGHNGNATADDVPLYDEGQFIYEKLSDNNYDPGDPAKRRVFKDAMWVAIPLLEDGHSLLESNVTIKLRVRKPYVDYLCLDDIVNQTHPLYSFSTQALGTSIVEQELNANNVSVYPNPALDMFSVLNQTKVELNSLELYNLQGQLVMNQHLNLLPEMQASVELDNITTGVYFIVLRTKEGGLVKKLVVN